MKRAIYFLLLFITIPTTIVYLASCSTPYIPPYNFWPLTFLAIGFPFIAISLFGLLVLWFFFNRKISFVLLLLFFVGYKNLSSALAINLPSSFNYKKDSSHIRVISWNVTFFENASKHADSATSERRIMINYLKKANADVLLLQEFRDLAANPAIYSNLEVLRDTLGYKYVYQNNDFVTTWSYGTSYEGCAILSKYPITDTGKILYPGLTNNESIAFADIIIHNKKVRFFTTHLLSMSLFKAEEVQQEGKFINSDRLLNQGRSRFDTIHYYDSIHARQAQLYKKVIATSPYPVVVSGDFNSLPTSYVYHTIRGKLKDAFLKKGVGFGQTYIALSPTLRIDYILLDPKFKVGQFTSPRFKASDHFPVVADVSIR
ncbi:MAG TPA: endonuclease/exonuclease/phosphatase family protein [Segetibacter sp.]|jgi:endonuclease/exonuclease/phosphatase family metal-dependent hydrolase